uniref:C-type lectin domain-containing protein n=1 Tax=Branchiostoma floridae TaxID=7739 RepID=C3Z3C5_BRAFL|eukprot:XP_002596957.1 hypothetical protein BRAFLDRAFT_76456 [Branchiostoma floridae]
MYEQAQPVRSPVSGPDISQTSGPQTPTPAVHQSGQHGRGRHGNVSNIKRGEGIEMSSDTYEEAEAVNISSTFREARLQRAKLRRESPTEGADDKNNRRYVNVPDTVATSSDSTYPGGTNGRRVLCDFARSYRGCIVGVTAVVATLVIVGLVVMVVIYREEISQLSDAFDDLKRNIDDMSQLSNTVDDLKRNMDDMSQLSDTVDGLKRNMDDMSQLSDTVDGLKRSMDDISQLSDAFDDLKRNRDDMSQLSDTVDGLKRNMDGMSQLSDTVDGLKRSMDDMSQLSNTVDDLKRIMDIERNRSEVLEACLREPSYQLWRGICYKAFDTREPFNDAAAACRKDGGTLAMPRDAETNAVLISLFKSAGGYYGFFIGLQDQREEGRFEWADGSALGVYNSWAQGEPDGIGDCVVFGTSGFWKDKWFNYECDMSFGFVCQAIPG